ncbi:MAG TPA: hypothetical protein VHT92_06315 [Candidatus Cybelea sp.]|jgi:hypothetical protein|nr:hypothetical protein [Candidatus Cybelea sp.]
MRLTDVSLVTALCVAGCSASSAVTMTPLGNGAAAAATSAAFSCRQKAPNAADPDAVHGLMVWLDGIDEIKKEPSILTYLPKDRNLCGASIVVLWSAVDKGPGASPQYDFATIDQAMQPWIAAKKIVNLLFVGVDEVGTTDHATPPWVLAQTGPDHVDVITCSDPGNGKAAPPTPVYWEQGYAAPWHKFIGAAIAHYGSESNVGYMRFGLGAGAEDFPQHGADGNCFALWQSYGLSAKFWAQFSARLTAFIAADARRHNSTVQQLVALNPFNDPAQPFDVVGEVANVAAKNGVGFGTENLGSGHYGWIVRSCTSQEYWCGAFQAHAGQVPLEFQPINFTLQPGTHIAPLPKLLPYAMYNHAQVFEIYPQDWLTADDPYYDTYAAHHVAWKTAFTKAAAILGGSPAR